MDINDFIKNYKKGIKLGKGSFGDVFEVEYKGVKYALKVIPKIKISDDLGQTLFKREIEVLKKMSKCENSVKYYCNFKDENSESEMIVLELCDCELEDLLNQNKGGFDISQIRSIMEGLNKAFSYMLMNDLVHRDIKLENIMVKYTDSSHKQFIPKINDYGLSRELKNAAQASTYCGSPIYMAPEILLGQPYNNKSDLWSIGVMMYQMYFREIPFEVNNIVINNDNLIKNELNRRKKKVCQDKVLDDLLDKLLTFDPIKRLTWRDYFNHPFFNKSIERKKNFIDIYDYMLEYMTIFGRVENLKIKNDEKSSPNKFISIDECTKSKDDHFFILGILGKYLENIGVHVVIDKNDVTKNADAEFYDRNLYQFICNSYILNHKYSLDFGLKEDRLFQLVKNDIERCKFNEKLKNALIKAYNLDEEEIIITNYRRVSKNYSAIVIFKSNFNKDITKDELINIFKNDEELKLLTNVKKDLVIPAVRLSKSMLYPDGDNKDSNNWAQNQKRGGEKYIPPIGWIKYGLLVNNKFDNKNNDWLSSDNRAGEWCTGYCGFTGITKRMSQQYAVDNDFKHSGQKVGTGVYCYNNPKEFEENTETINTVVGNYKIGFIVRVKPDKIRNPNSNKGIWVVNGNDNEIRPYGILLKKE